LWQVALSAGDSALLGFKDQRDHAPKGPNYRGQGDWHVFNLKTFRWEDRLVKKDKKDPGRWLPPDHFRPLPPTESLDGWKVYPTFTDAKGNLVEDIFSWAVGKDTGKKWRLPTNEKVDGLPRCYTFLKPLPGKKEIRLIVGHYWGASVFELTAKGPR